MKKSILLICLFFLSFTNSNVQDYYEGYIVLEKHPITNAKIQELESENYTYSDKMGYFKLKRNNTARIRPIVVIKNNNCDTVRLIRKNGSDAKPYYILVGDKKDTIKLEYVRNSNKNKSYLEH